MFVNRVIFGCHHIYVVHHPKEINVYGPSQITYQQAIEEIAIFSGYIPVERKKRTPPLPADHYRVKEGLLGILPKVYEANLISEELDKKVSGNYSLYKLTWHIGTS